jgi:phospholipid/cholesterol/gamma-HCH transport system substrate-binding protein
MPREAVTELRPRKAAPENSSDRTPTDAGKAFRVGLFVAGSLAALAAGVFLIASKQFLFKSTYHVRAQFNNVGGLVEGAAVRVGGIPEGTVQRMDLPPQPDGKVTVIMQLDTASNTLLKKDSVASIKAEGLLGDKYVEISFGSADAEQIRDGDTIGSSIPLDYADLMKKADQLLDSAQGTMQNAASITAKINSGTGSAGALINDKKLYQQANAAVEQAKAGATAFSEDAEALKHNFLLRGFFHNRGYEDANDLAKHEISQLPKGAPRDKFEFDGRKLFDKPDGSKLKDGKSLNSAGKALEAGPFSSAVVTAHTGLTGDSDKDRQLSQARAMVVRDYLAKNFKVDDTKIKTMGLGKPTDPGDADKLEILVYANADRK